MNHVAEEMLAILNGDEDVLQHYGMPRRSGRYPWGSGDDPYQHGSADFLSRVQEMKNQGMSEHDIAEALGFFNEKGQPSSTKLRIEMSIAKNERRMLDVARAKSLKEDGLNNSEIGRKMGINESSVRSLLNTESEERMNKAKETADILKKLVDEKGMIDVGTNVERELGVSKEKLNEALYLLEREGYPTYKGGVPQVTNPGKQINQKILCPPGTEHKEIYNYDQIHTVNEYTSDDGGMTFRKLQYPASMDSSRLKIRYAEEGGIDKDGIVEIRRGVDDLSLGNDHYSQVRILVDNDRYIKGMAVYSDDMPDGIDIVFNTNKSKDVPMRDVLKKIKDDPDNPFGSLIKANGQSTYIDKDGNEKLSLINKRAGEGDWEEWKNTIPSQFLGKQSLSMAKKQLNLAKADKLAEYDDICSLTNPTIKKHLLEEFASNCDAAAVHLKAAALPGQKYHVIIPVNTLKDNEVYAPNYDNGTKLALIRYPHGGTFEIPILTVNNKHAEAKKLIGDTSIDAIGITKNVADRLSGADFDGDTVMAIPTHDIHGKVKITSTPPLKGLEGFDPKDSYQYDKKTVDDDGTEHYYRNGREFRKMTNTQTEMGVISNLITDMTLAGASDREKAAAVRHSMVVIDAEKHGLDYKQSEIDNNIASLKKKYQKRIDIDGTVHEGGASTILSRAKGQKSVLKRQGTPKTNIEGTPDYDPSRPEGALIFKTSDKVAYTVPRVNKRTGEVTEETRYRTQRSTNMAETDDAYTLISEAKHPMEIVYADYANSMKALANQARKEIVATKGLTYDKNAKATYQAEVDSLNKKLDDALLNSPRERAAQRLANAEVEAKKKAYKEENGSKMPPGDVKKASQQAISKYRDEVGAISRRERNIEITDREWEAIQAGAISNDKLTKILNNTDVDALRERAMPRATSTLSPAKIAKAKSMSASNYSLNEIAKALNVSTSTVSKYLKGGN